MGDTLHILILCTGNSARSVITEGLLNHLGGSHLAAYSAGSMPTGKPNPFALEVLAQNGIDTSFARSKSWDEFAGADAVKMDVIVTVCANASNEVCPVWPGHPSSAHWGVADPAAISGSDAEKREAFAVCFAQMKERVSAFITGLEDGGDAHLLVKQIEHQYPDIARTA